MIEYRVVANFYYNKNKYQLLIDDNNRYFFMKFVSDKKLDYVNLKEYLTFINIFYKKTNVFLIEKNHHIEKRKKIIPKVVIGGIATVLTFSTIKVINYLNEKALLDLYEYRVSLYRAEHNSTVDEDGIQRHVSFDVEDKNEKLTLETKEEDTTNKIIYIYDLNFVADYFGNNDISYDEMIDAIDSNSKISDIFKNLLKKFVSELYIKYPDVKKRILYENIKLLNVVECEEEELHLYVVSSDAHAAFFSDEHTIYTLKNFKYDEGTWDYQVIFHEFSHMIKNGDFDYFDKTIKVRSSGQLSSLSIVDESLNSLLAISLFDYEEKDIAYQLQSNYCKVILESINNYSLTDYANHGLNYFFKKLDEHNGDNNYASVIFSLISLQYEDFHSDLIEVESEEYYPIYDYICDMYYSKYITQEMSYSEAKKVADTLIDEVTYDVPLEYNIDTNRFYDCLDSYCELIGINIENNKTL